MTSFNTSAIGVACQELTARPLSFQWDSVSLSEAQDMTPSEIIAGHLRTLQEECDERKWFYALFRTMYAYDDRVPNLALTGSSRFPLPSSWIEFVRNSSVSLEEFVYSLTLNTYEDIGTTFISDQREYIGARASQQVQAKFEEDVASDTAAKYSYTYSDESSSEIVGETGCGLAIFDASMSNPSPSDKTVYTQKIFPAHLGLVVESVFDNSPCAAAGVLRGDVVMAFNDVPVSVATLSTLRTVTSGIHFEYAAQTFNVTLGRMTNGVVTKRDRVELSHSTAWYKSPYLPFPPGVVHSRIINSDGILVGYLRIADWLTCWDFWAALAQLKAQGMQELVIDVRYNPGGYVSLLISYLQTVYDSPTNPVAQFHYVKTNRLLGNPTRFRGLIVDSEPFRVDSPMEVLAEILGDVPESVIADLAQVYGVPSAPLHIGLERVFVLASSWSASASDAAVVVPSQFGRQAVHIGSPTFGKYSAQTIVAREEWGNTCNSTANAVVTVGSFSDSLPDGVGAAPDEENMVVDYVENMRSNGDVEEPFLRRALDVINGNRPSRRRATQLPKQEAGPTVHIQNLDIQRRMTEAMQFHITHARPGKKVLFDF